MISNNPFRAYNYAVGQGLALSTEKAGKLTESIERGEITLPSRLNQLVIIELDSCVLRLTWAIAESIRSRAESRANRERSIALRQYMDEILTRARR